MLIDIESKYWKKGVNLIAGVDEVGRGCLAGPMVVAAVILNPDHINETIGKGVSFGNGVSFRNNDVSLQNFKYYNRIKDSKKLSPNIRTILSEFIKNNAISYSIEIIENTKIDEWGISKSTQIGFFNVINKLKKKPDHILTDSFKIAILPEYRQTNITRGDSLSISIAAASIVAKVYRDNLMVTLHNSNGKYALYGFDKHKGYGTRQHLAALLEHGPADIHRKSFKPVRSCLTTPRN